MRWSSLAIFVYGFAKKDRANITREELMYWRTIAKDLVPDEAAIKAAVAARKLIEVIAHEEQR